ncbi:MAG: zinc ribbon domain-containing protein [Deltaproteobacteria bacterium]|nr:zinc ribbon domain-containing protein [Deltaproteobacteria bacterium]
MPIYEYQCEKCGEFEVTQKITEEPLKDCPTCGQNVKKLISNSTFKLMGTGWYLTDYARKGKSSDGAQPSNPSSKSETKTESGSDTKKESSSTDSKTTNQKGSASTASSSN